MTATRGRNGLWACIALAPAQVCMGADFAYEVSGGLEHSDNVTRSEIEPQSESIASAGLRFSLSQSTARLQADAIADLAYSDYLDDTYQSELIGSLSGDARFGIVQERFEWMLADHFGQSVVDATQASTPDNRENLNVFETGPDFFINFGSRTHLRLGGRYMLSSYEEQPLDSESLAEELSLVRDISSASAISLNVRAQQLTYSDLPSSDYDQQDIFLTYEINGARTRLGIDAGYSEVDPDIGEKQSSELLRLSITREISAASTATLEVGREFSNSANAFVRFQDQTASPIRSDAVPGQQNAQPFTDDYINLGWTFTRNRTDFGIQGSYSEQSYEDQAGSLDQELQSVDVYATRRVSAFSSVTLGGFYTSSKFEQPASDYDEVTGLAEFRWGFSQRLSLGLTYNYTDRSSDAPGGDFTENRFWLFVAYGRGELRGGSVTTPSSGSNSGSGSSQGR